MQIICQEIEEPGPVCWVHQSIMEHPHGFVGQQLSSPVHGGDGGIVGLKKTLDNLVRQDWNVTVT